MLPINHICIQPNEHNVFNGGPAWVAYIDFEYINKFPFEVIIEKMTNFIKRHNVDMATATWGAVRLNNMRHSIYVSFDVIPIDRSMYE
jgi:hypothetical protein